MLNQTKIAYGIGLVKKIKIMIQFILNRTNLVEIEISCIHRKNASVFFIYSVVSATIIFGIKHNTKFMSGTQNARATT